MKLGVLISGRGSNMEAIAKACQEEGFPAEIAVVISNKPEAGGLEVAASFGIPTHVVNHKDYDSKADFEAAPAPFQSHPHLPDHKSRQNQFRS